MSDVLFIGCFALQYVLAAWFFVMGGHFRAKGEWIAAQASVCVGAVVASAAFVMLSTRVQWIG